MFSLNQLTFRVSLFNSCMTIFDKVPFTVFIDTKNLFSIFCIYLAGTKRVHASGKQPNLAYAQPDVFEKAAVAADNKKCSEIGVETLKKGGSAADAIVSTHCCVEIVNSHSTGLGGGGFMVYYDKKSGKDI